MLVYKNAATCSEKTIYGLWSGLRVLLLFLDPHVNDILICV